MRAGAFRRVTTNSEGQSGKTCAPFLRGTSLRIWTFWADGVADDGSRVFLIGSADNLLSVDRVSFKDDDRLRPGFNYPSSPAGLTVLIRAVWPQVRIEVSEEEWRDQIFLEEDDIVQFALDCTTFAEEDDIVQFALDCTTFAEEDEEYLRRHDPTDMATWVLQRGKVHGLARVFAASMGQEVTPRRTDSLVLPGGAQLVVAAPYALYLV